MTETDYKGTHFVQVAVGLVLVRSPQQVPTAYCAHTLQGAMSLALQSWTCLHASGLMVCPAVSGTQQGGWLVPCGALTKNAHKE